jgi:hypothetical protein
MRRGCRSPLVIERDNFATRTAAFVLPTIGDNAPRNLAALYARQRFRHALAVEVPTWLASADIKAIENSVPH